MHDFINSGVGYFFSGLENIVHICHIKCPPLSTPLLSGRNTSLTGGNPCFKVGLIDSTRNTGFKANPVDAGFLLFIPRNWMVSELPRKTIPQVTFFAPLLCFLFGSGLTLRKEETAFSNSRGIFSFSCFLALFTVQFSRLVQGCGCPFGILDTRRPIYPVQIAWSQ